MQPTIHRTDTVRIGFQADRPVRRRDRCAGSTERGGPQRHPAPAHLRRGAPRRQGPSGSPGRSYGPAGQRVCRVGV